MTSNVNPNVSQDTIKSQYHSWAKGFLHKGKETFHPYTHKNFKFKKK